ncbi:TPA: restriction endonuclease subunit S [Streptococcus suis]
MKTNNNIPAYRFQGYTDAWELRPLGEIGNTYTGLSGKTKDDFGHGDGRFVTYMNVFSNPISLPEMVEAVEIDESQNTVRYGDVLFTTSSETPEEVGMSSVWLENTENTYLNSFCFGFRLVKKVNPYYLAYLLRSSGMRRKISFLAQGISRYNISKTKMMELEISIPNENEQKAIGTFFSTLDQQITLHQRKLDTLKEQKMTYLKLLFPAKGQTKPALRFQGFEDDWKEVKVSDIFQVTRGQVLSTNLVSDTKSDEYPYPVYSSQTKNNGLMGFYKDYLFDTAITWTTDGANAGTVRFREGKFYSTNVNGVLLSDEGYSNIAISEILNTVAWKYVSKVGNPKLMNNIMSEIILLIPGGFAEQQVLSSFFQTLDQEIAQVEDKLASLKEMKKTLLRKLFV